MIRKSFLLIGSAALVIASCTKLDEKFRGQLAEGEVGQTGNVDVAALLKGAYNSMQTQFQDQVGNYALGEMTTDELIGPTRGADWDDNGVWRVLHEHSWDGDNLRLIDNFRNLNGAVYATTNVLNYNPTPAQAAEARLLRAMAMYKELDGFDQVPYRDPGESTVGPSRVRKGAEALDYIIAEITDILPTLPAGPAGRANVNAGKALLMKCYLNKGVFASFETRQNPTFAAADMNQVITLADQIINSGNYSFTPIYFDNFAPQNTTIGTENIWTQQNDEGISGSTGSTVRAFYHSTMHYNQVPQGWNGFSTLSDFYDKFEATDKRRGVAYPPYSGAPPNPGARVNVGILAGQQYNLTTDAPLDDRTGAPLIFTPEVSSIETGTNLEITGYRAYKYPIDYTNDGSGNIDNDYVYLRLADVLLMKAEAILRGGTGTAAGPYGSTPLAIVNYIRTLPSRGASALGSVTLDVLLDERSREMYLEGWRREDLVRFGKFLQPFQEKPGTSDPKYLLFAIPNQQLAVNPNLKPNPGY
ncbi:MAG: RagB/SusD family nutrient uptake outer membrane protein [Chitinophagaceae bacterium]|nr:MAG: RagB/SusD family nutrient uptake outer membrane protein [Chitinophagaceae bacterium]